VAPRYVRRALWLQRWIALSAFATVVAVAATDSCDAEAAARAELGVSAFVLPVAVLQVEHQAPELLLTAVDIARGYVDVPAASRLAIRTSSRVGYMLDFHARLPLFTSVQVTSASGRSELGPDGGTLVARGAVGHGVATSLSYRFQLDGNIRAGSYPWPLAVSVRPL
ncbi:MAG: hypothetical protein GZ089_07245, partial [Aromatoleum sp.]|nr:hypothetical protein [Aromatoleum sp.]